MVPRKYVRLRMVEAVFEHYFKRNPIRPELNMAQLMVRLLLISAAVRSLTCVAVVQGQTLYCAVSTCKEASSRQLSVYVADVLLSIAVEDEPLVAALASSHIL